MINIKKFCCMLFAILLMAVFFISYMPLNLFATTTTINLSYCAHVQDYGWFNYFRNPVGEIELKARIPLSDDFVGTTGQSKRMEALEINFDGPENSKIMYRAHVQDHGWMDWVTADNKIGTNFTGTTGQSRRVEAFQIVAIGLDGYEIKYRVHVQDHGWMKWITAQNSIDKATLNIGNYAGTVGQSRRIEAIEIAIIPKENNETSVKSAQKGKIENIEVPTYKVSSKSTTKEKDDLDVKLSAEKEKKKEEAQLLYEKIKKEIESKLSEENKNSEEMNKETESQAQPKVEEKVTTPEVKETHENHTFSEWKTTVQATCQINGVEERKCTECGYTETRKITKPHELVRTPESDVEATCTKHGAEYSKCKVCGQIFFNVTPILGHNFASEKSVIKPATCTEKGLEGKICTRKGCNEAIETSEINPTGHSIKTITVEPTCIAQGKVYEDCENCDYEKIIKTIPVSEEHDYKCVSNRVEATCEVDGREEKYECSICGKVKGGDIIKATGHNFVLLSDTIETDDLKMAECSKCKCQIQYSGNKVTSFGIGHTWNDKTGKCSCGNSDHDSVWWNVWANENTRHAAIWHVGFTCDLNKCVGFNNHQGGKEETVIEGRRGDIPTIKMQAPEAKSGYKFEGWYQVLNTDHYDEIEVRKITRKTETESESAYIDDDGKTIVVPWRDMDKGFEARYVLENGEEIKKNTETKTLYNEIEVVKSYLTNVKAMVKSANKIDPEQYKVCVTEDFDNGIIGIGHDFDENHICKRCHYEMPMWTNEWASKVFKPTLYEMYGVEIINSLSTDQLNKFYDALREKGGYYYRKVWYIIYKADTEKSFGFNGEGMDIDSVITADWKFSRKAPDAKPGYKFVGWFNAGTGEKVCDSEILETTVEDCDKTFEAHYEEVK